MSKPPPPTALAGDDGASETRAGAFSPRAERVAAILPVHFRNAGQFLVSYCLNISRGGLFVTTPDPAPVGTRIELRLTVPELEAPLALDATVRWIRAEADELGPTGMGLRFEDVDDTLGERIDLLVQHAKPLHIVLIGRPDRAGRHLESIVRSLVTCTTTHHELALGVEVQLRDVDLVIVDVDADAVLGEGLLGTLANHPGRPPVIALCSARQIDLRDRISAWARVVATPVDKEELQSVVLESLSQADAQQIAGP